MTGSVAPPPSTFVLVAAEIGPADLLQHLGHGLVGAVAVRGGANSHAAIIARSVGIPLVTGVQPAVLELPDHTRLLVDADADAGLVIVAPAAATVGRALGAGALAMRRRAAYAAERRAAHRTADGHAFTLLCNVATDVEARLGRDSGAEGIGLFRTELAFLDATRWPGEAEHRRVLRPVLAGSAGWPVTVRLLDFAGDKVPPFLAGADRGPVGLAALLAGGPALGDQLRAVLDTGRALDLKIMVPMVSAVAELAAVRAVVQAVADELSVAAPPVGAMIETVAAVTAATDLAGVADFLSIGTNDLTGEVLGLDRRDPRAGPELSAHPRALALIGAALAAGRHAGLPVSVCGDAAAYPATLALLVGAGADTVSVACARVDQTRYVLRRLRVDECRALYTEAIGLPDAAAVLALVRARSRVDLP